MEVNLFGNGFIGSNYNKKYLSIVNSKNDLQPVSECSDVLYTISTIDNYNIFNNLYVDVDTNLTHLLRVLEQFKIMQDKYQHTRTFNFVSSWFVYGDVELPATEESYCNPKGFYSITKRTAEQLLISFCETFNLQYRIFRLANVVGYDDTKISKKKNALCYLLDKIKTNMAVELYEEGNFFRDYIEVTDAVNAINLLMKNSKPNQIYNISNGDKVLFKSLIDHARRCCGSKSKIVNIKTPKFHEVVQVKNMVLDNSKLKSYGYEKKVDIYDYVRKYVRNETE